MAAPTAAAATVTGPSAPGAPPEMTLTIRAAGPATVTVEGRERREIAAELITADDRPAATRDMIAMSGACGQARGELPLHATVAVSGAVAWAGRLDDAGDMPDDPVPPEVRLGPCPDRTVEGRVLVPLYRGEDHVQVRTRGNWMCVHSLRGLDDDYTVLAGLAGAVRRVIGRYEAGQLNAMTAFGEIEELFAAARAPGTIGQVSRVSDYEGAGPQLDAGVAALRSAGVDPAMVSVACALGRHGDCDGTIEAARQAFGQDLPRCRCPAADGHRSGH